MISTPWEKTESRATTTSATGGNRLNPARRVRSGFTLVEIVIVLVIVSLIIGLIIPSAADLYQYERLRSVAADTAGLVKATRREAVIQRRDMWLKFDGLLIQAIPMDSPNQVVAEVDTMEDVRALVKPWLAPEWQKFDGQRVRVTRDGILEPFEILFRYKEAYISYRFDPLTGGIAEEENTFP